jgi:hypothetical protein
VTKKKKNGHGKRSCAVSLLRNTEGTEKEAAAAAAAAAVAVVAVVVVIAGEAQRSRSPN